MDQSNESSNIEFEGEEFQRSVRSFQRPTPKMVQWVIKYSNGYIKEEKQANYVLIGFIILAIIIVFIFLFSSGAGNAKFVAPVGKKIIYPQNQPPRLE